MYCRNCGARLEEGAFFCVNCGIRLNDPSNETKSSRIKNKKILFVVTPIILAVIILYFFFCYEKNIGRKEEVLKLNDISVTYDSSKWERIISKETENAKVLQNKNIAVALTYDTSDYYVTTASFATEVKKYYEQNGYTILEDLEPIGINGNTWYKLIYSQDQYKIMQLFFSNNYDTYSFVYKVKIEDYDNYLDMVKDIYGTLTFDITKKKESEKEAKANLIGEWDWGISGYFVIDEDKIYLYKDNTKSMDNVYYGTYEADNKVKTYATGYIEGMYVLMTLEKAMIGGEEPSVATKQVEFVFIPNEDGTYTIENLYTGASGIATKVK